MTTYIKSEAIKDASIEGIKIKDAQIKTVDDKTVALERDLGQYAELPSQPPTEGQPLKNFVVKSGVMGTDSAKLAIVIDTANFPLGSDYQWTIAKNSKGEIKQYCEADLIN